MLALFSLNSNDMRKEHWKKMLKFCLPVADKTTVPSEFNSIKAIKAKFGEFPLLCGKNWDVLCDELLDIAKTNMLKMESENSADFDMDLLSLNGLSDDKSDNEMMTYKEGSV